MDIKEIKSLIKMIMETDISEFELENADEKIRIKRGEPQEIIHYQAPQQVSIPHSQTPQPAEAPTISGPAAIVPAPVAEKGETITSPIVGTFYRAPAPDAPPYVEVGQVVEKGQVLCIIEAMKLMNEILAEKDGEIADICTNNGQIVEFAQTLFTLRQ